MNVLLSFGLLQLLLELRLLARKRFWVFQAVLSCGGEYCTSKLVPYRDICTRAEILGLRFGFPPIETRNHRQLTMFRAWN